jgi:hypothetical protein
VTASDLRQKLREVNLLLPVGAFGFLASVLQIVQLVIERQYSVILVGFVAICFIIVATGVGARGSGPLPDKERGIRNRMKQRQVPVE